MESPKSAPKRLHRRYNRVADHVFFSFGTKNGYAIFILRPEAKEMKRNGTSVLTGLTLFNRNASSRRKISVEEILGTNLANVPDRNIELTKVHSLAFHQYKPKPYHGIVTLFRARNRSVNEVVFGSLDPKIGWEKLAMGGVQLKMVDGFHRNIHLPPYVQSLASELGCCLESERK